MPTWNDQDFREFVDIVENRVSYFMDSSVDVSTAGFDDFNQVEIVARYKNVGASWRITRGDLEQHGARFITFAKEIAERLAVLIGLEIAKGLLVHKKEGF